MTCRHGPGDTSCTSRYPQYNSTPEPPSTPDKYKYNIVDMERVGAHVVLKVLYPNCKKCAYEGNKVMVFLNVTEKDIITWREIDPHFRAPDNLKKVGVAPPPAARFPASVEGWKDAIEYANSKLKNK